MHSGAKTIYEREAVFDASIDLLKRHYGYVPLSWVFGYATWRRDGRDQFFQPLRPTVRNYLASLPIGLRLNSVQASPLPRRMAHRAHPQAPLVGQASRPRSEDLTGFRKMSRRRPNGLYQKPCLSPPGMLYLDITVG